jgi:hypothetical protein
MGGMPIIPEKDEAQPDNKDGLKFINPKLTEKTFAKKQGKAAHLAKTTASTKPAAQKINESEQAQDKPTAEQQSDSQEGQVAGFADQNVTNKSKEDGKKVLGNAIDAVMPKKIEDLTTFKKEGKGKNIGDAVSGQVKGDVGSVKNSFAGMGTTPAPAPAAKGAPLPQPEAATHVEPLQLGTGVIPGIEPAHLDTKDYLKQNDALLKQEELPQEHLDMVDSGDLAEANKERAQLKTDTVAEPKAVKEASATEHKQLNSDLHAEETQARNSMSKHRSGGLKDTGEKQQTTKTKLEKEREAVAKKINDKFTACQTSILGKLDKLEKDSLAKFDQGQAKATTDFEEQVNKDIEAFKDRRYSGELGALKWLKDVFVGIDEFPEVKNAFTNARSKFENNIDALLVTITADNNKVIAECKKELADTKKEIADYVRTLKGSLKDVGQQAMKDVNDKLKKLDEEIDKRKEKLQQQLTDKRAAAMKAIDDKIAKMKEKLSGAISIIGKLLLDAAKKFFKWALEKLGVDAEAFFATLVKAGDAIKAIFKNPGKFFSNLIAAIKGSINDFKANFKTYIIGALADWLTGAMGGLGIDIPKEFTVRSVILMLMQVLGLSWAFLRSKLVMLIGEQKVAWAERTVDIVKKFMIGGVAALWDWIKDQAASIKDAFIESTKGWLLTTLVTKFTEWIASLLIPGGAILRLIQGIYNLVMWFVNNIQKIIRWVNAVMDSLGNIALGAIAAAIGFIVNAMKLIIPIILNFVASILNISGIVEAIKKIIDKIAKPIHDAIDRAIKWIVAKVKAMFGKGEEKPKPAEHSPEVQEKIDAGLIDLRTEEKKHETNGKITHEEAEKVAQTIKGRHAVFSKFYVIDGGNRWNYKYAASPDTEKDGSEKAEGGREKIELLDKSQLGVANKLWLVNKSNEKVAYLTRDMKSGAKRITYFLNNNMKTGNLDLGRYDLNCKCKLVAVPLDSGEVEYILELDFNIPIKINNTYSGLGEIIFDDAHEMVKKSKKTPDPDGMYGLWVENNPYYANYGGKSLNLMKFWKAKKEGLSNEDSAFKTITGQWALKQGYTKVDFLDEPSEGFVNVKFFK